MEIGNRVTYIVDSINSLRMIGGNEKFDSHNGRQKDERENGM